MDKCPKCGAEADTFHEGVSISTVFVCGAEYGAGSENLGRCYRRTLECYKGETKALNARIAELAEALEDTTKQLADWPSLHDANPDEDVYIKLAKAALEGGAQ